MAKKLQFIQDVEDPRGNVHSVLIYGKGDLRLGNMTFATMREVKAHLLEQYPDKTSAPIGMRCKRCGGPVTTAGEGNLRYSGCEVCGAEHTPDGKLICAHQYHMEMADLGLSHCDKCGVALN